MPIDCQIVEASERIHHKLAEIVTGLQHQGSEPERIGDLLIDYNSAEYKSVCTNCLGEVSVRHIFTDGPDHSIEIKLPASCPKKPNAQDSPVLYYLP